MNESQEQANKCILIARRCIAEKDMEKAERMLEKSLRLFRTTEAEALLTNLRQSNANSQHDESPSSRRSSPYRNATMHGSSNSSAGSSSSNPQSNSSRPNPAAATTPASTYTKEQIEAVRAIRRCKDYYEILGVEKSASEDDLKRSYRKLALKFHPDKNKAPGASEAFKAIGNAFSILSNADKRKRYDQFGPEADQADTHYSNRSGFTHYSRGFESDFSPEEIFNMFFGGGYAGGNIYRQHRTNVSAHRSTSRQQEEGGNNFFMLVQLLPLFILFGMSFFSNLVIRDPYYSLSFSNKFSNSRITNNLRVPFYVKDSFNKDYQGRMEELEREVEEEYVLNLRSNCVREKQHKENMVFRARYYGDEQAYNHAIHISTPNCDQLRSLSGRT